MNVINSNPLIFIARHHRYKVTIFNEGSEPVQIVARMWEIEKVGGSKETVRGAGIMSACSAVFGRKGVFRRLSHIMATAFNTELCIGKMYCSPVLCMVTIYTKHNHYTALC